MQSSGPGYSDRGRLVIFYWVRVWIVGT